MTRKKLVLAAIMLSSSISIFLMLFFQVGSIDDVDLSDFPINKREDIYKYIATKKNDENKYARGMWRCFSELPDDYELVVDQGGQLHLSVLGGNPFKGGCHKRHYRFVVKDGKAVELGEVLIRW